MDTAAPLDDRIIRDAIIEDGSHLQRLTVQGQNFLLAVFPDFGGSIMGAVPQNLAQSALDKNWGLVTWSWPNIETSASEIYGVSIAATTRLYKKLFKQVAHSICPATRLVLISRSVTTTAGFHAARENAARISHFVSIAPGWSIEDHMVNPLLGSDPVRQQERRSEPALMHPVSIPGQPRKKAFIPWEEIESAKWHEVLAHRPAVDGLPPTTMIIGDKDPQIAVRDVEYLQAHAYVGKGSNARNPKLIVAEDMGHDFKRPHELPFISNTISSIVQSLG